MAQVSEGLLTQFQFQTANTPQGVRQLREIITDDAGSWEVAWSVRFSCPMRPSDGYTDTGRRILLLGKETTFHPG